MDAGVNGIGESIAGSLVDAIGIGLTPIPNRPFKLVHSRVRSF